MLKENNFYIKALLFCTLYLCAGVVIYPQLTSKPLPPDVKTKIKSYELELSKHQNQNNTAQVSSYLTKLAYTYWQNNSEKKAVDYFNKLLEVNKKLNNKNALVTIHTNLGIIYSSAKLFNEALTHFNKTEKLAKELNSQQDLLSVHINKGMVLQNIGKYNASNANIYKALATAKEKNDKHILKKCYRILGENYKKLGNSEKSYQYINKYSLIEKQIQNEEIEKVSAHAEIMENEKRQKEFELKTTTDSLKRAEALNRERLMKIELLNKENKINELTIKQREAQLENEKLVRKSLIWGLAIVLFFSFLLLIQYRQIKRANKKLAEQYAKINKQKQEITEQKEVVERQNKHINDSISYGLTIQKAMLPTEKVIKRYFETFIIYRPKDIVSGDFYWFYPNKEEMVSDTACLAAIDCTGHGVPGAFMSMIGNRLLNEIVTEKQNFNPATILDHLNKEIISTLNQEKNKNEDGMDVCLCSFKSKDNKIVFAGAKRPLFIYDNNNKDVRIVQGERKSIGGKSGRNNEIHYANKELQVNSGDILYLTSDGMIDQNGPDRKRFGSKRLIEFLKENASLDMKKQKNKLEEVFDTYTNNEEQRDDILVIGIKFF